MEVGNGASIDRIPIVECDHKHSLSFVSPLFKYATFKCACYYGCVRNELKALVDRHLMAIKETEETRNLVRIIGKWFIKQVPDLRTAKWDEKKVVAHKSPSQRKRVLKAFDNLREHGWSWERSKDVILRAFTKFEKMEKTADVEDKAPRMIQHRSYEFCARLAQYIMPMEEHIWHWDSDFRRAPVEKRVFAKRLNSFQRAERLKYMFEQFEDPAAIPLDFSRLDAHLLWHVMDSLEFPVYRKMNRSGELAVMLDCMKMNRGVTRNGIFYRAKGRKASGELITSLGDSLCVLALLLYWLRALKKEILVDGDDCVIVVSRKSIPLIDMDFFSKVGFKAKIEKPVYQLEEVDFCQCRPVEVSEDRWRMVRNPWRVFSRTCVSEQKLDGASRDDWVASVGLGELACNMGVPVMQAFALKLMKQGKVRPHFVEKVLFRRPGETKKPVEIPITSNARVSFALAWGIWPSEQLYLEQIFSRGV